jgi:hypothetical protein
VVELVETHPAGLDKLTTGDKLDHRAKIRPLGERSTSATLVSDPD